MGKTLYKPGFWPGAVAGIAVISLFEDILGQEHYIEFVRQHWTPAWISVPVAILALTWAHLSSWERGK